MPQQPPISARRATGLPHGRNILPMLLAALLSTVLVACGGGGGSSSSNTTPSDNTTLDNILPVTVDGGPSGSTYIVNRLFASVTVCVPNTTTCQTIDHVLIDTGSTGLRLISSTALAGLGLPQVAGDTGYPLLSCQRFLDGSFAWGSVRRADVVLGNKTASAVPVQIIADPSYRSRSSACGTGSGFLSATGSTASALGANGILGVGNYKEDCGSSCVTNSAYSYYYHACNSAACSATVRSKAALADQVKNPVAVFAQDNNGLAVVLPTPSSNVVTSMTGSIIFGVDTKSNNQTSNTTLMQLNSSGNITTSVNSGAALTNSFLDTGSNGLFFDTSSITKTCSGFYCPNTTQNFSATLSGSNGVSKSVSFAIEDLSTVFTSGTYHVLPTLGGPISSATTFDWGLPFFYGKTVFIGIDGMSSSRLGAGPYYAF